MRGVSKEHRPSPIVQMGLFLDSDGLPLGYELFPGNRNDMTTLLPAMSKAGVRDLPWGERVVVVADKGLNTSANIAACVLDGNGYIFSQSVRKATKGLKSWVLDDAGYEESASGSFKIKSRISEKAVYVAGEDGKRRRVMVSVKEVAFWSRDYFERSRCERAKVVEKSRAAVARGGLSSAAAKTSVRYAKDVPVVRGTGEAADHNWVVDEERIAADEAMDGCYCIVTSEQEMDDRDVIDAYRGLWRIEESFRVMKGDLGARPVYCSTESHIRAHFLVCYVALLVMRLMQLDTGRRPLRLGDIRRPRPGGGPPHAAEPLSLRPPHRPHRRARRRRWDRPVAPGPHPRPDPLDNGGCEETEELGCTTPEMSRTTRAVSPGQERETALVSCKSRVINSFTIL